MLHLKKKGGGLLGVRYDASAKSLVWVSPQDFVTWVLPGARYLGRRDGQFQTREIRSDGMIEADYNGQAVLIHVEFQSKKEAKMVQRLLGYSYEANRAYNLPVLSCVIYLQHVADVPEPPHCWELPEGPKLLWFNYLSIQLADTPVEVLQETRLSGLLPLLVLSKGGAQREVLDGVLTRLAAEKQYDLLENARLFAGLVFPAEADQQWINRRFAMLRDYLRENSWTYKQTVQEGIEQGLEKGLEQGLEQGRVLEARQNIELFVRKRFPALLPPVNARIEEITDLETLQDILLLVGTARTIKEVKQYSMSLNRANKRSHRQALRWASNLPTAPFNYHQRASSPVYRKGRTNDAFIRYRSRCPAGPL
jgi:predicted transposase YdaD